jgi:hypothetical protein
MSVATSRWPHVRSSLKRSHHSNTPFHTMRHLALTQRAPAFSLERAGRARLQIDRYLASERLARNRTQNRKSHERSQFAQVAGFPQCVVKEAIGTRKRNERHLTSWTRLTRRNVVLQDPRHAQGKEKNRSRRVRWMLRAPRLVAGPNSRNSSVGIPRAANLHNVTTGAVDCTHTHELRGPFGQFEGLAKSAEKCPLCAHAFPIAEATITHRQSQGALVLMARQHGLRQQRGSFLVRDRWPTGVAGGSRCDAGRIAVGDFIDFD